MRTNSSCIAAVLFSGLTLGSGVHAEETLCRFYTECVENEGCGETDFDVTITPHAEKPRQLVLQTGAETLRGTGIRRDGPGHAVFTGDTALHVISAEADGPARYTVHLAGPMTITFKGTCEVVE